MKGRPVPATAEQILRYGQVAAVLREAMDRKGLSLTDVQRRLNTSSGTVWTWLAAKSAPSQAFRLRLASMLDVDEAALDWRTYHTAAPIVVTDRPQKLLPGPRPPPDAPATHKPIDVLQFSVSEDGQAVIRLNARLPIEKAAALLRLLLDAGLVTAD
jgi:transcriptional regulator with XRE-family HTH domain